MWNRKHYRPTRKTQANLNPTLDSVRLLIAAGADVNWQLTPRTPKWQGLLCMSRWAARLGTKSALLLELASFGGLTPLMDAAKKGKVAEARELLGATADPTLRTHQGLTALEVARQAFGGTALASVIS